MDVSGISNGCQLRKLISEADIIEVFEYFAIRRPLQDFEEFGLTAHLDSYEPLLEVVVSSEVSSLDNLTTILTEIELTDILDEIKDIRIDRTAVGVVETKKRVFQKRSLKTHSFPPVSPQSDWLESHQSSEISPFGPLIVNDGKLLATPVFSDADSPNHQHNSRPSSAFQSAATSFFSTASSSIASFFTAKAGSAKSPQSAGSSFSAGLARVSPWRRFLKDQNLLPTDLEEQNWSDRGQHAEYRRHEHSLIPLQPQNRNLGHSANAIVDVVRCKRILLARKTIRCNQRMKREDAAREVAHLQAVNHAHVVRLVGTYVFEGSKDLHILLYPVADCDLEAFMDVEDVDKASIKTFFACLAGTLAFLHARAIKHMDIKPRNLLVKDMRGSTVKHDAPHKIYLADFGISRSYDSALDAETCSPTSFTRIYSAPEVVKQETRGLKADIFSLGCVYAEMLAAVEQSRDELIAVREASPVDRSYQANLEVVRKCVEALTTGKLLSDRRFPQAQCLEMLEADPEKRPSAEELVQSLSVRRGSVAASQSCCGGGADPFEMEGILAPKNPRKR